MTTRTIQITEEAFECLRSHQRTEYESFSQVILRNFPLRRNLSDILSEIPLDTDFADATELFMLENRRERARDIDL